MVDFAEFQNLTESTAVYPEDAHIEYGAKKLGERLNQTDAPLDNTDPSKNVPPIFPASPPINSGLIYVALGLASEAGEVAGVIKKMIRDDFGELTHTTREKLKHELGDLLWYLARLCTETGLELEDVARANLIKLEDRKSRGVLQGIGDER